MGKITFFIILCISSFGYSQSKKVIFKSQINYLPSSICRLEYYITKKDKSYHYFKENANNCYSISLKKKKKETREEVSKAIEYIINNRSIENMSVPISGIEIDSITMKKLKKTNKIRHDSLIINFKEFKEIYYKTDSIEFGISFPRFDSYQIDGNRLFTQLIVDNDTVFTLNIGNRESPHISKSREWLLFYIVYQKYHLFNKLMLDGYFSKEKYHDLIHIYIEEITKHSDS